MQVAMLGALEVRAVLGSSSRSPTPSPPARRAAGAAGAGQLRAPGGRRGPAGRVLPACPHVRILATSREPLAITAEALWTVGPLTLPPDPAVTSDQAERAGVPAPAIVDYASVRLLTQRARAVVPGFEVTLAERALWRRFSRFAAALPWRRLNGSALAPPTVRHGPDGTGAPRYRMLEIIRAYGQERLAEAGERDQSRQAHARYFTQLARTARIT